MPGIDAYTKLMLHSDKINGGVSKAITPIGDVTIKTAEFKFDNSSGYFDGASDYLTITPDDDLYFGSGDFTIDCWIRPGSDGTTLRIYGDSNAGDDNTGLRILRLNTNKIVFVVYDQTLSSPGLITGTTDILAGSWYHIACVRSGNTLKLFINGTQEGGDVTFSVAMHTKVNGYRIGRHGDLDSGYFFGYIDEFRISKGIARWTANFAVPTSKYIADQYTALLLHFTGANNSTVFADASGGDESGNEKVITYNGKAEITTAQSKFGSTSLSLFSEYTADSYTKLLLHGNGTDGSTTITDSSISPKTCTAGGNAQIDTAISRLGGASMLFDGNGDYITVPDSPETKLLLHLNNNISDDATGKIATNNNVTFSSITKKFGTHSAQFNGSNSYLTVPDSADWNMGTGDFTVDFWVNYSSIPTFNYFFAQGNSSADHIIYYFYDNKIWFAVRVGNVYSLEFHVPFTPSTSTWYHLAIVRNGDTWNIYKDGIALTKTLTNGSYTGISIANYTGTFNIMATYDGTLTTFPGYLDEFRVSKGITRWTSNFTPPTTAYEIDFTLGNDNWTFDCWIYVTSLAHANTIFAQKDATGSYGYQFQVSTTGHVRFITYDSGAVDRGDFRTPNGVIATDTWYHIEVSRNGSSQYIFIDGVAQSLSVTTGFGSNVLGKAGEPFAVGHQIQEPSGTVEFQGNIDEFRFSKGIVRHTADFNVNGYLSTIDNEDWNFGSSDFTIDCWVNFTSLYDVHTLIAQGDIALSTASFALRYINSTTSINFYYTTGGVTPIQFNGTWTPSLNTWYHIAVVRVSGVLKIFINGTSLTLDATDASGTFHNSTAELLIGVRKNSGSPLHYFPGKIDELRVSKGIARWTNNFTPPVAAYDEASTSFPKTQVCSIIG